MSSLDAISKAAKVYEAAKSHAERSSEEMGDAWADELIAYWRSEGECSVAAFMETVKAQGELRDRIEANLLRDFT